MKSLIEIVRAMEMYQDKTGLDKHEITFVDIGANIGWLSRVIAAVGYNVISFEPFPFNEIVLRQNQCAFKREKHLNKWVYFNNGLGDKEQECSLTSASHNYGDGIVFCGRDEVGHGMVERAKIDIKRLDDIFKRSKSIFNNVAFVKMDVEGFEGRVVAGGQEFFAKVPNILFELNCLSPDISSEVCRSLVQDMKKLGYTMGLSFGLETDINPEKANLDVFGWKSS